MWFFRHVAPQLIAYSNEHSTRGLIIVGHSLGAATAAILTIILTDYIDEFRQGKEEFMLKCYGYAPACGLSLDIAEKYKVNLHTYQRKTEVNRFFLPYRTSYSRLFSLMI